MARLNMTKRLFSFALIILACSASPVQGGDVTGSSDHPMLSRFPGTTIVAYDQRYHDVAFLPTGPATKAGLAEGEWAKGRLSWIVYEGPADRSTLEIYKNYENALKEAGFEIGFNCKKDACGRRFINKMLDITGRMVGGSERWMPDSARYLAARLPRETGNVWVSLMLYERNAQGVAAIRLEVIEANSPRKLEDLVAREVGSKSVNYDEIRVASGMVEKNQLQNVLDLEGEIQWKAFAFDHTASAFELYASYRDFLEEQNYNLEFECHFAFCGRSFIRKVVDLNGNIIAGGERWSQDSAHYFMAKLVSPQKLSYASLLAYEKPDGTTVARLLTVEPQEIEFNLITVTGESLADEIEKTGKVAVYGIYFDTDSAEIKAESAETLAEIARLMQLRPDLSLYIDGHTDNEGADDYNLELSSRRAAAVVLALVEQQGVSEERLEARGLGETEPVASNDSDEGRAWNRRVELVAR